MTGNLKWGELGAYVLARREMQRLSQAEVASRGGPSEITLRKIERGEVTSIRNKTKQQLDRAMDWPDGTSDRILTGDLPAEGLRSIATILSRAGQSTARTRFRNISGQALDVRRPGPDADIVTVHPGQIVEIVGAAAGTTPEATIVTGNDQGTREWPKATWERVPTPGYHYAEEPGPSARAALGGLTTQAGVARGTGTVGDPQVVSPAGIPSGEAFGAQTVGGQPSTPVFRGEGQLGSPVVDKHVSDTIALAVRESIKDVEPSLLEATSKLIDRLTRELTTPAVDAAVQSLLKAMPDIVKIQADAARATAEAARSVRPVDDDE